MITFQETHKKKINVVNKSKNFTLELYLDEDENEMPPLEDDEEVKSEPEETIAEKVKLDPRKKKYAGTRLKILIPNKLWTRLPILLPQIKAGNNSYKLINEIRQMSYLLQQHNKINKKVYNNSIKSLKWWAKISWW